MKYFIKVSDVSQLSPYEGESLIIFIINDIIKAFKKSLKYILKTSIIHSKFI